MLGALVPHPGDGEVHSLLPPRHPPQRHRRRHRHGRPAADLGRVVPALGENEADLQAMLD